MLNSVQLFGLVLLGGLTAGEIARRGAGLPRTTGFVVCGLLIGQSGLQLVQAAHLESAQLFTDLALGLILFELGHHVQRCSREQRQARIVAGTAVSLAAGSLLFLGFRHLGFDNGSSLLAAALCLATSPAITIATASDVGARGERSNLLFTLVAANGAIAFTVLALLRPLLDDSGQADWLARLASAVGGMLGAVALGLACSAIVLIGARWLARQSEHQHLLILGSIVLGVGTAIQLEISVLLPMLLFGILVRALDRDEQVIAIRIASDARVFLVITFVLAGAVLDLAQLVAYWPQALLIAGLRFLGHLAGLAASAKPLQLAPRETLLTAIGLQPMSSVALVLLVNAQTLYTRMPETLSGILLATILLMQLCGPLATQTAIRGFGEATRLKKTPPPKAEAA